MTLWLTLIVFILSSASLLWSLHFEVYLKKVIKLLVLLPPQIALLSLIRSLTAEQLDPYVKIFPYAFVFSCFFLCFEIIGGGVVFNFVRGQDIFTSIERHEFNHGAVALVLFTFSALSLLQKYCTYKFSSLMIIVPLLVALFYCESQSAGLAMIVGGSFLFLFPYQYQNAWRCLKFVIITFMITAPFFVSYVYHNYATDLQDVEIMARASVGHRLEIWDYISRYLIESPIYGFGIEMTRATVFDSHSLFDKSNTILHPHNFAIQIWIEFGAVGIIIASGLIYVLLTKVQNDFTYCQQKILLPTIMAAMGPAAFAYGLWQGWWIALLFHAAAMALIACKFVNNQSKGTIVPKHVSV